MMTTTRRTVDILIQSSEGTYIAIVEVKNIKNLSPGEAVELRQNLIAYGLPYHVPFFFILSQDRGFLWKNSHDNQVVAAPSYDFPMENVVARYSNSVAGERLYGEVFEIIVFQWLTDLSLNPGLNTEEPEKTLALSGFNEAIKGATILLEASI